MFLNLFLRLIYRLSKIKNSFIPATKINLGCEISELPFVIVITSFNNIKYCKKNLESVLRQNYTNYRVIYVDDCSDDGTASFVKNFLEKQENSKKFELIVNTQRQKKLANLYNTIQNLYENEIVIELDGDDYLMHENVLSTFNMVYQTRKAWLVYANYENNPVELAKKMKLENYFSNIPNFVKTNNLFRDYPWAYSGLRSYYACLFKKIKKQDLIDVKIKPNRNDFYPVCHDNAMFYPMLEMARHRIAYIQEPLLLRNIDSSLNDFKVYDNKFRNEIMQEIRNAPKYQAFDKLF